MKIYDPLGKRVLDVVTVFLTPDEARQLAADAKALSDDPSRHHEHLSSPDYQTELTIAVYTRDNLDQFDADSRAVIATEFPAPPS